MKPICALTCAVRHMSKFLFVRLCCYLEMTFFTAVFEVESYRSLERNTEGQPDGPVSLAKWRILNRLHDRNETLYYRVSHVISS